MIFDPFLKRLDAAREKYERDVREILADMANASQAKADAILGKVADTSNRTGTGRPGFKYAPGTHWTQTARGKKILKRMAKATWRKRT